MRVLVLDNDAKIRAALSRAFRAQRMHVSALSFALAFGRGMVVVGPHDLAAVGAAGIEFADVLAGIARLRSISTTPIVCYGCMHWTDFERARALDSGADALVDFPFDKTATLIAQIRAVVRRRSDSVSRHLVVRVGAVEIDLAARTIAAEGHQSSLTRNEVTILARLAADAPIVVTYEDLYLALQCKLTIGESRAIKQAILRLRKKLGTAGREIVALPGVGYRLSIARALDRAAP